MEVALTKEGRSSGQGTDLREKMWMKVTYESSKERCSSQVTLMIFQNYETWHHWPMFKKKKKRCVLELA